MIKKSLYRLNLILIYFLIPIQNSLAIKKKDLDTIKIKSIAYRGTGCPQGSVFTNISPDKEIFTVSFNQFVVSKNGALTPYRQTKNCLLSIVFKKPRRLSFSLFSYALQGASDLQENVLAKQDVLIRTLEQSYKKPKRQMIIKGPYDDEYERTEEFDLRRLSWSSCNKKRAKLTIKTKITVAPFPKKKNHQSGFMSVDQVEGFVKQKVGILWRDCQNNQSNKSYFSFCKVKVNHKKKNKTIKQIITRAKGKTKAASTLKALERAKKICNLVNQKRQKLTCSTENILCKTQKLFNL